MAALSVPAQAADVYVKPAISVTGGYDDNVRLEQDQQDGEDNDQTRLELAAEAELGAKTRTREAVLNAETHVNRYASSELNSTDWFLDLDLLRRWRRDELGLSTSYARASTLTTELEDTGRLEEDRYREDWSISPSWTHKHSRRTETTLGYAFTDVSYEEGSGAGLTDYQDHRLESLATHSLSRTTSLYGRADYTRYDSEAGTESDNVSLLAGLERNVSRRLQFGVGIGAQYTNSEFRLDDGVRQENSESGLIFEANASWALRKSTVSVEGSRRVESSGRGTLAETDTVQASWTRSLTRAWDLNLNAAASRREFAFAESARGTERRKYYNAEAKLVWSGLRRWQIDLAYRHRRQELDTPATDQDGDAEQSADSNAVWLTMRYTWARTELN